MFLGPFYFDSRDNWTQERKRKNSISLRVPAKWAGPMTFVSLSMWSKPMRNLGSCELEGNRGIFFICFWSQETCLQMGLGAFAVNMIWMVVHYAQASILRDYLVRNFSHSMWSLKFIINVSSIINNAKWHDLTNLVASKNASPFRKTNQIRLVQHNFPN